MRFQEETVVISREYHRMNDDDFFNFCNENKKVRIERNANKDIIIMSPTYSKTGNQNSNLLGQLYVWNQINNSGYIFDSSAGFTLPSGAVRSPDVSWIRKEKFDSLAEADKDKFAKVCPDFVIELKSHSDSLEELKSKMKEWIENGCLLALLIDPEMKRVYVYSADKSTTEKSFSEKISGGAVLNGFELDLSFMN